MQRSRVAADQPIHAGRSEGSEFALGVDKRFDPIPRHVGRGLRVADTGLGQPPTKGLGCVGIAEAGQVQLFSGRSELPHVSQDRLSNPNRQNGDPTIELSPSAGSKCLDGDLIADPLNEDDGLRHLYPISNRGCSFGIGTMAPHRRVQRLTATDSLVTKLDDKRAAEARDLMDCVGGAHRRGISHGSLWIY